MNRNEPAAELVERRERERRELFDSAMQKQNAWAWRQTRRTAGWLTLADAGRSRSLVDRHSGKMKGTERWTQSSPSRSERRPAS